MTYYRHNLATIHHLGFGGHADNCAPGVLALAEPYLGSPVLEIGCGSGALTKHLVEAGHKVVATDASPAMLDLARQAAPRADVRQLTLPHDPIPDADFIVGVGHPLNYLANPQEVERAVDGCIEALRPGGMFAVDVCDLDYAEARAGRETAADVREDWAIFVRFSLPEPTRFVREMTTFLKSPDGTWDRDDEIHTNLLIDLGRLAGRLESSGLVVSVDDAFGEESLPPGLRVLKVERPA